METKRYQYTADSPATVEAELEYVRCADGWRITRGSLPPADNSLGRGITVPEEIDGIPVTELNISWFGGLEFIAGPKLRQATIRISSHPLLFRTPSTDGMIVIHAPLIKLTLTSSSRLKLGLCSHTLRGLRIESPDTRILENGFRHCPALESAWFSGGITELGAHAFENCRNLCSVLLPTSLTAIPDYCFSNCSALEQISFPPELEQIGDGAFAGCQRLRLSFLPHKLTRIGTRAFYGVPLPNPLIVPPHLHSLGAQALGEDRTLTICGIPGTAAERYAAAHRMAFLPR